MPLSLKVIFSIWVLLWVFLPKNGTSQVPGVNMDQAGVGTVGDTQSMKGTLVEEFLKIDPFVSPQHHLSYAEVTYDSMVWPMLHIHQFHPYFAHDPNFQTIGDPGMPAIERGWVASLRHGFNYGITAFDHYLLTHDNNTWYRAFTPFTRFEYVQMPREFIHLNGLHTQNIHPGWNIGIRFRTINNGGLYPNQRHSMRQAGLFTRYMNAANRYYAQGSINTNNASIQENGGWANDSIFDRLRGTNKSAETLLQQSSSIYGHKDYTLEQVYWTFGNYTKTSDTTRYFKPISGIKLSSSYQRTHHRFRSTPIDFIHFPHIYYDSLNTRDSVSISVIRNTLSFTSHQNDSSIVFWDMGIGNELNKVYFNHLLPSRPGANWFLFAKGGLRIQQQTLEVNGAFYLSGFNRTDFFMQPTWNIPLSSRQSFITSATLHRKNPDFIFHHFESNHLRWHISDLSKETIRSLHMAYEYRSPHTSQRLTLKRDHLSNPVYLNVDQLPAQEMGSLAMTSLHASLTLKGGPVYLHHQSTLRLPDNKRVSEVLPFPVFSSYQSLFLELNLFQNVLKLQTGLDLMWFSEYYGRAYDPITKLFYLQTVRKQGNYPMVNAFANIEIKSFRMFIKWEHASFELFDSLAPNLFYSSPGYSMATRRLVIGVTWKYYK